ncbi:MAG: tRNA pseudouridine(38-40) synthase TruA [Gemmatimonadota bacterium]|nr:tRNA pseudouridine(38-40) synthase TruA [Gemmatimonadota bacterium]
MPDSTDVRYRATIEYDGSGFAGYQIQPAARTVQGTIESRLARLLTRKVRVHAAGRTDAGVHAVGQEISFEAPARWTPDDLFRSLSALLPDDVSIRRLRPSSADFHPRFDATGRRYEYFVGPPRTGPLRRDRVWATTDVPDWTLLSEAASLLVGPGSFEALSKAGQPELGTECSIELAEWTRTPLGDLRFTIVADRFLHRMVRYIVGTMVEVGAGRRDLAGWTALLRNGCARPPEPAPAGALYLTGVRYPDGWNREPGVPGLWPIGADETTTESV